jgi:hypothetical protein
MKPLRILLLGVVGIVLLLVVVIALAFTPAVQTWIARKFAPSNPALTVLLERVSAGLNGAHVENVRVVQPGLVLTLPSLEVEASVADAAGGRVAVKKLVAKGWILDLSVPLPATTPAGVPSATTSVVEKPVAASATRETAAEEARTAFNGLFGLVKLPFDLAVDGVELSGEVILPQGRAQVSITGGSIAAGRDGKFILNGVFTDSAANTVTVKGDISAHMDTPRSFDRFGLVLAGSAKGTLLPKGAAVDLEIDAALKGADETYLVAVRSGSRELMRVDATLPAGDAPLAGRWKMDINSADAAGVATGQELPEIVSKGSGTFEANRVFSRILATGSLDASFDKLSVLNPEYAALGRLLFTSAFDLSTESGVVRLNKLNVQLAGERPVFSLAALQPVEFNLASGALTAADSAKQLVSITLDGLPLAWAKPFLGDLALAGDDVRGAFNVSAHDGGFSVIPVTPITLGNLSVSQAGRPLVRGLDIALTAQAEYSPKGLSASVSDLSVRSGADTVLKLTAKAAKPSADKQPMTADGTFEVNLAAVLAQPVAAGSASLSRGTARGEFSASAADVTVANLTLQLTNLVAADAARTSLPSVAVQARVDIDAAGLIHANAPVLITQAGRRSDLTLGAIITSTGDGKDLNVTLTSDSLAIPDLQLFAALAPTPVAESPTPRPTQNPPAQSTAVSAPKSSVSAPTQPVWAGVTGEVNIKLKKIIYTSLLQVNDVVGVIAITPSMAMLKDLHALLNTGGKLNAVGGLTFDANQKQPYALKADLGLSEIDAAPLMRALSPGEPSPVEGKFTVSTSLSGRAVEPAGFSDSAVGDLIVSSKGGVFKALSVKTSAKVDNVSKVAALAGLFGAVAGNETAVKYAERARAAADVTKQFASIPFDQLNLVAGRDDANNITMKDLTLLSPVMSLTGSGKITAQPGVPVMQQPLLVNLKIGARDEFADNLRILKLITGRADKSGYAPLVEDVTLDGTLQAIGTSQLSSLINRALTN